MSTPMTDNQLKQAAEFYGIEMEEAKRRHDVLMEHNDDPADPICVGCAKKPIETHRISAMEYDEHDVTEEECRRFVIENEGTLNYNNGHYLCDPCYIKNGSPSSERGWVCP